MSLYLAKYPEITEAQYIDYISEWERENEKIVPSAMARENRPYDQIIQKWREDETELAVQRGFVPSTLYFLKTNNDRLLGAIHFRHYLNERLRINGGHIGYGVRKSERKKGYARTMLRLLIEELGGSDIQKVLITCDDDNIGSVKTIESCRGVLQDKVVFEGKMTRRYWIDIK